MFIIFSLGIARKNPLIFAVSALALSITLTPYYYIAIPIMFIPIIVEKGVKITPLVLCIIAVFMPFIFVENILTVPKDAGVQSFNSTEDLLGALSTFIANYRPNIFTYMSETSRNIWDNGPIQFIDPASLVLYHTSRVLSLLNASNIASIARPQDPNIAAIQFFALSTLYNAVVVSRLLIALTAFGVVVAIAGVVGSYIPNLVRRIPAFEEQRMSLDLISPIVTAVLGSVTFLAILLAIAPPLRLTTSLAFEPANWFYMTSVAGLVGGVFTAREYVIQSIEAVAIARQRLAEKLSELETLIKEVSLRTVLGLG